jgi:hypothetical protein
MGCLVVSGVLKSMASDTKKNKHEHTFKNGTILKLAANSRGLKIGWQEDDKGKHPAVTLTWKTVRRLSRHRTKPKTIAG